MSDVLAEDPGLLKARWNDLARKKPLRSRDAAQMLGVTEAHLVASLCGERATRLDGSFGHLLEQMPRIGRVMTLTRNEACVHEKSGRFEDVSHNGGIGLALGNDIDLRFFLDRWRHGFLVEDDGPGPSFQFFDGQGDAVHKIYLRDDDYRDEWLRIADEFRAKDQSPALHTEPRVASAPERSDADIDVAGFRDAWSALRDTHDFFGMLRRFHVARTQALRLADPRFAWPVSIDAASRLLLATAGSDLPIMVFVGNPGCIQIHSGPVVRVERIGPWMNVLDAGFNLHLREDLVASAWLARKPTTDGIVTSVEIFDGRGELIAQFFGARKPGTPEMDGWRSLTADLFPAPHPGTPS